MARQKTDTHLNRSNGSIPVTITDSEGRFLIDEPGYYNVDAFGRRRISQIETLFDSAFLGDSQPLLWHQTEMSGAGTSSNFDSDRASMTLSVSNVTAGRLISQTFQCFNYEPGKSHLIIMTGILGTGNAGITKRIGYFDENNGVYFEQDDNIVYIGSRSAVSGSPVDLRVVQSAWNLDTLDGNGRSQIVLDETKTQIFVIDFEWLGVGRIRYGFNINGVTYWVHEILNANVLDSVYMSSPNLPVRYEIENDGTGPVDSLEQICTTVMSEGDVGTRGYTRGISRGETLFTTGASNTLFFPLISIRLKTGFEARYVIPQMISALATTNTNYELAIFHDATVSGVDAASWVSLADSGIEYDFSRDITNTINTGTKIFTSLVSNNVASIITSTENIDPELRPGAELQAGGGFRKQEMIIAVKKLAVGAAEKFSASIMLKEGI